MRSIPNTTGSNSDSETSWEDGNFAEAFTGKDYYKELINRANTVSIIKLFKYYGVRLDKHNTKTTCPFKSHKDGRERTPSFVFYPETNTFFCFGCKAKSRVCDFVAEMDHCSKVQAANKILKLFESDVDEDNIYNITDFEERLKLMMSFSDTVREFHQTYPTDPARLYVEKACKKFDALNLRHKFDNKALSRTVEQLKKFISLYKP